MTIEPPVTHVQYEDATSALQPTARRTIQSSKGSGSHPREARADSFEETLAWVRAKSAERRRKYRRYRGNQKNADCSKLTDKIVTESLERGRAALADAEEHMKRFEQYVNPPTEEKSDGYGQDVMNFASRAAQKVVENMKVDETKPMWYTEPRASLDSDNSSMQTVRTDTAESCSRDFEKAEELHSRPLHSDDFSSRLQELLSSNCTSCQVIRDGVSDTCNSTEAASCLSEGVPRNIKAGSPKSYVAAFRDGGIDLLCDEKNTTLSAPAIIDAVISEGEKRARREEQAAAARRSGDKPYSRDVSACGEAGVFTVSPGTIGRKRPNPTACIFDPNQLKGAKRSALKAAARAEEEAAAEADAREKTLFKARPLPQGGCVHNDPYALTKAAMGKRVSQIFEDDRELSLARQGSKGAIRMDASVLLESRRIASLQKVNTPVIEKSRCGRSDASPTRKRRQVSSRNPVQAEKVLNAQKILDSVDESIFLQEDTNEEEEMDWDSDDDVLAISELQHRIARMEAELRHKQELSKERAARIEDLSEPLVAGNDALDFKERKKSQMDFDGFGCDAQATCENLSVDSVEEFAEVASSESLQAEDVSLFKRHEKWVERRRRKLEEVRLQKADEAMRDVTGRPQLDGTKESWLKAKAAHNEAARRAREEQERRRKEREEREARFHDQKLKEMADIQEQARKKKKLLKSKVNKNKQIEAVEKLSRPKKSEGSKIDDPGTKEPLHDGSNNKTINHLQDAGDSMGEEQKGHKGNESQVNDIRSSSPEKIHAETQGKQNGVDVSFAEMNDKEFAKMLKTLGINAKKEGKKKKSDFMSCSLKKRGGNRDKKRKKLDATKDTTRVESPRCKHGPALEETYSTPLSLADDDDAIAAKLSSPNKQPADFKGTDELDLTGLDILKGKFASSAAQAALLKKLGGTDLHEYTVANASSALEAVESEFVRIDRRDSGRDIERIDYGFFQVEKRKEGADETPQEEPYERYEAGKIPFFDPRSSSDEKGRFRVRDAREFAPNTMRRRPDDGEGGGDPEDGIMLLVGRKEAGAGAGPDWGDRDGDGAAASERPGAEEIPPADQDNEQVITILFDRSKFNERAASDWWMKHRSRFVSDPEDDPGGIVFGNVA